eukprot:15448465-Alexandrium_andersonii.AAC.1
MREGPEERSLQAGPCLQAREAQGARDLHPRLVDRLLSEAGGGSFPAGARPANSSRKYPSSPGAER